MPGGQEGINLPKRSLIYLLICVAGIAVFILVALLPSNRSLAKLDKEIDNIKAETEGKKILFPLLTQLLAKTRAGKERTLPLPNPKPLPEEETGKLSMTLGEMARQCNLKAKSVTPDFASIASQSKTLRVDLLMNGGFFDFRKFLLLLGEQPFLQGIEQIQIREIPGGREFRLRLRLLIG